MCKFKVSLFFFNLNYNLIIIKSDNCVCDKESDKMWNK